MLKGFIAFMTCLALVACIDSTPNKKYVQGPATEYNTFSKNYRDTNFKVAGKTLGYGNLRRDGYVDFAVVFPALKRQDLLFLDIAQLVSPETDTIEVPFKSFDIPSNLALPKQSERYSLISIGLDKPQYRFFIENSGRYKMVATHGRFPLKKVIDDARGGKSAFEIINHFQFMQSGSLDVDLQNNLNDKNINVNQVPFRSEMTVKGPTVPSTEAVVAIALRERNGLVTPTDLKSLKPNRSQKLKTTDDDGEKLVAYIKRKNDVFVSSHNLYAELKASRSDRNMNQMSLAIQSKSELNQPVHFLPLIPRPVNANNKLTINAPEANEHIAPLLTYVGLVEIEDVENGRMRFEKTTTVYEDIIAHSWPNEIDYPEIDHEFRDDRRYRWVIMFAGQKPETANSSNELDLNLITQVTRNALDL